MVVVWWRLLTSLQLSLFASHVTSSTMRNEGVVEGVSDITHDGDAAEGVTLWGLPELSGRTLSGLAAVSALTLSLLPRPCRGGATGQSATLWRLVPWWCPIYNFSKQLVHRGKCKWEFDAQNLGVNEKITRKWDPTSSGRALRKYFCARSLRYIFSLSCIISVLSSYYTEKCLEISS